MSIKTAGERLLRTARIGIPSRPARSSGWRLPRIAVEEDLRHEPMPASRRLLKEVNHRVANSLQLVSAFVHMQSAGAARSGGQGGTSRTPSVASRRSRQVHRRLYTGDGVDSVAMDDYLAGAGRRAAGDLVDAVGAPRADAGERTDPNEHRSRRIARRHRQRTGLQRLQIRLFARVQPARSALRLLRATAKTASCCSVEDDGCGIDSGTCAQGDRPRHQGDQRDGQEPAGLAQLRHRAPFGCARGAERGLLRV